jgi:hypothetical protein
LPKIMSSGGKLRDAADSALWTKVIFSYQALGKNRKVCNMLHMCTLSANY